MEVLQLGESFMGNNSPLGQESTKVQKLTLKQIQTVSTDEKFDTITLEIN